MESGVNAGSGAPCSYPQSWGTVPMLHYGVRRSVLVNLDLEVRVCFQQSLLHCPQEPSADSLIPSNQSTTFIQTFISCHLDRFTMEGGMSGSYLYESIDDKYNYLNEVFETLIVRDIQQKYRIKNVSLLDTLNDFLVDNISSEVSARSVANTLTSKGSKTDDKTVSSYIKYLCASYAFYKIRRYDIKGKKYLASQDKYYLADHSFKYAKHGTKNLDTGFNTNPVNKRVKGLSEASLDRLYYGKIYENIVCIELLRRGYEVYTGVLYQKEIDFVAIKRDEKIYIQVSDDISRPETMERETAPLFSIKDAYPKMIIARTKHPQYQYEGIAVWDIAEWLVNSNF